MKKLSKRDYKKINKFYKSKKHTRKNALKTISRKFCSCVQKVKTKKKGEAIGICTKSVINRKGFKRGKFSCKRKPSIQLYKGGKRRKKTRKKRGGLNFPLDILNNETNILLRANPYFRNYLNGWWNTRDEQQRVFITTLNQQALEHLVNALHIIYQIEQQVQQGGKRHRKKKTRKKRGG
tara:strand:+ start:2676 stop:3212 length:537 start_codon:yes stop_codon:yes gene_type:complete